MAYQDFPDVVMRFPKPNAPNNYKDKLAASIEKLKSYITVGYLFDEIFFSDNRVIKNALVFQISSEHCFVMYSHEGMMRKMAVSWSFLCSPLDLG